MSRVESVEEVVGCLLLVVSTGLRLRKRTFQIHLISIILLPDFTLNSLAPVNFAMGVLFGDS